MKWALHQKLETCYKVFSKCVFKCTKFYTEIFFLILWSLAAAFKVWGSQNGGSKIWWPLLFQCFCCLGAMQRALRILKAGGKGRAKCLAITMKRLGKLCKESGRGPNAKPKKRRKWKVKCKAKVVNVVIYIFNIGKTYYIRNTNTFVFAKAKYL